MPKPPVRLVISHADEDLPYATQLLRHLAHLPAEVWHPGKVLPGTDRAAEIQHHLEHADLIVTLLSADYVAGKDSQHQLALALSRQKAGLAHLVPVLVRSVSLTGTPLEAARLLPDSGAISQAPDRDAAWSQVTTQIAELIATLTHGTQMPTKPPNGPAPALPPTHSDRRPSPPALSPWAFAALGLVLLLVDLALLAAYVAYAPRIRENGITAQVYYPILVTLGLVVAVVTFGAMESYAHYQGQKLDGTLRLGGPFLAVLLVALAGWKLDPGPYQQKTEPQPFDMTVRVFCDGQPVSGGTITVYLGTDPRRRDIDPSGEANIKQIPSGQRGQTTSFVLSVPNCILPPNSDTLTIADLAVIRMQRAPIGPQPPASAAGRAPPQPAKPENRSPRPTPMLAMPIPTTPIPTTPIPAQPPLLHGIAQCDDGGCTLDVPRSALGDAARVCLIPGEAAGFQGQRVTCTLGDGADTGRAHCQRVGKSYARPLHGAVEWRSPCP